jgi:hypothetical protein
VVTEASLTGEAPADYAFATELAFAFRLARVLKARREQVRGKPETFNRPDYNFRLAAGDGSEPTGSETVQHQQRKRGAPLDLIVAEAMILANSTWGGWLAELGVPGIYRSQASLAPGIKVRMGTKPAPHAGMGVAQYTWATSPLRRYVDLVNQWQIIACARHGRTAALAAPFKPKDAALFSIISGFDAAYTAYNDFQHGIERYWTLRWLEQKRWPNSTPRDEGRPGARRHAAAGLPRAGHREPAARHPRARAHHRHRPADAGPACQRWRALEHACRRRHADEAGDEGDDAEDVAARRRWHAGHRRAAGRRRRARRTAARRPEPARGIRHALATAGDAALGAAGCRWRARGAADAALRRPGGFNRVFRDTPLEVILVNARSDERRP